MTSIRSSLPLWQRAVRLPAMTPAPKQTHALNVAALFAAMAMIIMAAATPPDDRAASRTAAPAGAATKSTAANPDRERDFGAYLGSPYNYPSDFHLRKDGVHDLTVKNVNWFTNPFQHPLYYGVRYQSWYTGGRFGTMIDFTHSKAYAPLDQDTKLEGTLDGKPAPANAKIGDVFKRLEFSHGHNMLTFNGLMRFMSFGLLSPYAGIGAGISLPHAEMHLASDPSRTYEYQYTGPAVQALFGLELRLPTGSVFVEYKFTLADYTAPITHRDGSLLGTDLYNQFTRWWSGEPPPGGFGSVRLTSHQVIGGFLVRFVPSAKAR